ncbi:MAG: phosphate-starvation-inducible PsiE family protein, partial [Janthinobacterium lividum]
TLLQEPAEAATPGGPATRPWSGGFRRSAEVIQAAERGVYAIIGAMLVVALLVALAGAGETLWTGLRDWTGTEAIVHIIDRLLFVLMLVEILHTVHASLRAGTLVCEPFLIVGLIACIRRMLVITLETSRLTQPEAWNPDRLPLFHASMLELGVLALLIVVLVGAIRAIRTAPPKPGEAPRRPDADA